MSNLEKLQKANEKLKWFLRNKSFASYATSEAWEAIKALDEVEQHFKDALPQVMDLMDGKASLVYPPK